MQTHLSATSNKLNSIMKAFATISTLILPMSLIAGIYGMNFDIMPEIHWRLGYPLALTLMGLVGLTSYLIFRWRKWI
jgi:magnesium transporter